MPQEGAYVGTALLIRKATTADIPVLVRHRRLMFCDMGFQHSDRSDMVDLSVSRYLAAALPNADYHAWVADTADGHPVASIGLKVISLPGSPRNISGHYSYVMSLYVEQSHRRQGIATSLMREMLNWSRLQGITEVRLHAAEMGRAIYERMGFRQTDEMRLMLEE